MTDPDIVQYQVYCTPPPGPVLLPDGGQLTPTAVKAPSLQELFTSQGLPDAQAAALGATGGS